MRRLASTMIAQLDHLDDLLPLPGLDLRIRAFATAHLAPGIAGFTLFGDSVLVSALDGDHWTTDAQQIERYRAALDRLAARAATAEDALALIDTARRWHHHHPDT